MNPVDHPAGTAEQFLGAAWAVGLATALVVAMAVVAAIHWRKPADDEIVQIPVPVVVPTPTPRPEVLAPDPGDNP